MTPMLFMALMLTGQRHLFDTHHERMRRSCTRSARRSEFYAFDREKA